MPETDEMTTAELPLAERQVALVDEYITLRKEAEDDRTKKRQLSKIEGKIDELYWERVESIITSRIAADRESLDFSESDRLIIDVGLLDIALVKNAPDDLTQKLLDEIHVPGPSNHLYLSEWLEDRYHRFRLTEGMEEAKSVEDIDSQIAAARKKVMSKIAPFFESLPGVPEKIAANFTSGSFDDQILRSSITLLDSPIRKLFKYRSRLKGMRQQILEKARARAKRDQNTLRMFDMLDELYVRDWRERHAERNTRKSAQTTTPDTDKLTVMTKDKAVAYLSSELKFVKSLMPLGALAGGVTKTRAILLEDGQRVTKADTARGFALSQSCDRGYTVNPLVLIAPFKGRGIYEFDRDSLVVSLLPIESAEDSVANAAGNYRMLIDTFQNESALKKSYTEAFPEANFQVSFQADYRTWVTKVGCGETDAMDDSHRKFFRKWIGPDITGVLAPANLRNLGPQARETFRKRMEKQVAMSEADANLHRRLAVLCWQDGDFDAALSRMALAAKLSPQDGEILFSLGLLMNAKGESEKAKGIFAACSQRVPKTIWGVYAREAVSGDIFGDTP